MNRDDWRLQGQEEYLSGRELMLSKHIPANDKNDHDHCEFCWAKFAQIEGDLHEGYCTIDRHSWICETCFNDFKDMFNWTVLP